MERRCLPLVNALLPDEAREGRLGRWRLPLSVLTPSQSALLARMVTLKQLSECMSGTTAQLFTGRLHPFLRDPSQAHVTVRDNDVRVSGDAFDVRGGNAFFGTSIDNPDERLPKR